MKTMIIQTSPQHTGSTLLVNALYGLIPQLSDKRILGCWTKKLDPLDITVLKYHNINIDELSKKYKNYNLYFVCSERSEKGLFINEKYKSYKNVIVFDFKELNETSDNNLPKIIQHIHDRLKSMMDIELNIPNGIKRITDMNKLYTEIKTKPFKYVDPFYQLHGSHRNRK
jgi:hypothetical protein